jgi:hypothetical protein
MGPGYSVPLRVLVGCECSGRVAYEFAKRGHKVFSADLLPNERASTLRFGNGGSFEHYQGDVRDLFDPRHPLNFDHTQEWCKAYAGTWRLWDLIIAHPPCDHTSYAGARWFKAKQADGRQQAAVEFFGEMLDAPSPLVAVENPHSMVQTVYGKAEQVVEPWQFGDPYRKGIYLWLKGLPRLRPESQASDYPELFRIATGGGNWRTDKAAGRKAMSAHEDGEGRVNRAKVRSRTMPGLARAMAAQWGAFAEEHYRELE